MPAKLTCMHDISLSASGTKVLIFFFPLWFPILCTFFHPYLLHMLISDRPATSCKSFPFQLSCLSNSKDLETGFLMTFQNPRQPSVAAKLDTKKIKISLFVLRGKGILMEAM